MIHTTVQKAIRRGGKWRVTPTGIFVQHVCSTITVDTTLHCDPSEVPLARHLFGNHYL